MRFRNELALLRAGQTPARRDGAGLGRLHRADRASTTAPALTLGTSTALKRWTFFIGDPKRAKLDCAAPPTVLAGGTSK
jgi:hypothetical protein